MSNVEQKSAEWFALRKGKITGSRVGAILGMNPYSKPDDVMREMVREWFDAEREFTGNQATEYGNEFEPIARQDYEVISGNDVTEYGFIERDGIFGISPDGLIGDDGGVEIKCPFSGVVSSIKDKPHYYAQVCFTIWVTGRKWWDFFTWTPHDNCLETITADEADAFMAKHLPTLRAFHDRFLEVISSDELAAPYLADRETDLSGNDEWLAAVEHYISCKEVSAAAGKAEAEAKKQLEIIARQQGTRRVVGGGVTASLVKRQGNVNYKAIPQLADVDLEQYRASPTEYWSFR